MTFKKHIIHSGSSIKEALTKLDILASDAILFVVKENNVLLGSLTDGDVRRGLIKGIHLEDSVDSIIQTNPKYIRKGERDIKKIIEYRKNNFKIIPVLAKNSDEIINIINFRLLKSYLPLDAIIMAGGKGSRLKPLTDNTPKPLLIVGDKPIIEHNIDRLTQYGIDDFWITLKYLGNQIKDYLKDGQTKNISIQYIEEHDPLGTIGAVSLIENLTHDYVLITNSDLLTNLDYEQFFIDFLDKDADLSVLTIPYKVKIPYAVMETSNGDIMDFKEKPTYTYYSNGGIYLMKKEMLKSIPKNTFYNATDFLESLIKTKHKVISFPLMGYWLDIGQHEDYEKAKNDIYNIQF